MSNAEKDPLMGSLERMTMETTLLMRPKRETAMSKMPSTTNSKLVISSTDSLRAGVWNDVIIKSHLPNRSRYALSLGLSIVISSSRSSWSPPSSNPPCWSISQGTLYKLESDPPGFMGPPGLDTSSYSIDLFLDMVTLRRRNCHKSNQLHGCWACQSLLKSSVLGHRDKLDLVKIPSYLNEV